MLPSAVVLGMKLQDAYARSFWQRDVLLPFHASLGQLGQPPRFSLLSVITISLGTATMWEALYQTPPRFGEFGFRSTFSAFIAATLGLFDVIASSSRCAQLYELTCAWCWCLSALFLVLSSWSSAINLASVSAASCMKSKFAMGSSVT